MYVCMSVCVCVCCLKNSHFRMYKHTYTHGVPLPAVCMYACMYISDSREAPFSYVHAYLHTNMHAYMHTHLASCIKCVRVSQSICLTSLFHLHKRMHIHTYTHTYIHTCMHPYLAGCIKCVRVSQSICLTSKVVNT